MDRELFEQLKSEPDANKSPLQLNAEYQQREHQRMLRNMKRKPTPAEVEQAKKNFAAINAVNELNAELERTSFIAQHEQELQALITAALAVASPTEAEQVRSQITPAMLRHFTLNCTDYDVSVYIGDLLQTVRSKKALGL